MFHLKTEVILFAKTFEVYQISYVDCEPCWF